LHRSDDRMIDNLPLLDVTGKSFPSHVLCNAVIDDN
jgi:hypothetical protein